MWLQEVEQYAMGGGREVVKLLVGNKIDKPRVVTRAQVYCTVSNPQPSHLPPPLLLPSFLPLPFIQITRRWSLHSFDTYSHWHTLTQHTLLLLSSLTNQAEDWARSRGMLFLETSAKTREGIHQVCVCACNSSYILSSSCLCAIPISLTPPNLYPLLFLLLSLLLLGIQWSRSTDSTKPLIAIKYQVGG